MGTKIGIRDILAMPPNTILWDAAVRGFNARRQKSDAITFSVFYRTQDQQQRWHRIGRFGVWTPEQARKEAQRVLRARDLGEDPSGARMAVRNSPTMATLCDEYLSDMQSGKLNWKKSSTIKADISRIVTHIKPKLGKLRVASVTQADVEAFMHQISPGSAKRIVGLTSAIFSWAIKRKLRLDNPCRGIETPKDNKRLRRLSVAEYAQLWKVLNDGSNAAADIFMLLAVTGFRSGEARLMKYSELDLDRRIVTLADTKSGQSVRPLSGAAIEIIQRQPRTSEYVFGLQQGQPFNRLPYCWDKLGLDKTITPHILRHSFASLAADLGLPDSIIAGLLGHAGRGITSRYLHLGDKALLEASDLVANATLNLMKA
jgi:integrase